MDNQPLQTKNTLNINSRCPNCGSTLKFLPGTNNLQCESCGSTFAITSIGQGRLDEEETDYYSTLQALEKEKTIKYVQRSIHCESCGALILLNDKCVSTSCPFCGSNKVVEEEKEDQILKINGVIPFVLDENAVYKSFIKWINTRGMAPSKLKKGLLRPSFSAFYIPFYTFDADTKTFYTANRGDYYYVTRTYHSGKSTRVVTERRIRWTPTSGNIDKHFNDVLISGTNNSLKGMIEKITYYDFDVMQKYQEEFLLGYYTEKASVALPNGFDEAKRTMAKKVELVCISDIGGDTYSDLNYKIKFTNITFKQIVVPIYNGHYMFHGKRYNFICNGQNGKFVGNYPISPLKVTMIVLSVILILVVIFVLLYIYIYN